jgi:hypothetical protein
VKSLLLAAVLTCAVSGPVLAWGPEGHSIVAEVAQRRLSPEAAAMVASLLGNGHSLASIASWADDVRDQRPETSNWHFVDIPINVRSYRAARDCAEDKKSGDCIIAELDRLKNDLRCATGDAKVEALKFAVHFVGDVHQPLHTALELKGANDIKVDVFMRGLTCTATCEPVHIPANFHAAWDSNLILKSVWDWGAYVDRLEAGWLKSAEAVQPGIDAGTPTEWAEEAHALARTIWILRPADNVLDDRYYRDVLPVLDRQLGIAGLRLARLLNDAYAPGPCPAH